MLTVAQVVNKFPALYRTRSRITMRTRDPRGPILSHLNPAHDLKTYFFNIHIGIIVPLPQSFSGDSLDSGVAALSASYCLNACYMSRPYYYSCNFDVLRPVVLEFNDKNR
jgi:hypothetical protein